MEEREDTALQHPSKVAKALGISTSLLRRYARSYEEVYEKLPRDRQNRRLYTKVAVERLKLSRESVLQKRAPSVEVALRDLSGSGEGRFANSSSRIDGLDPYVLLVEELRWLRELVEEQNRRLAMMESRMMPLAPKAAEAPVHGHSGADASTAASENNTVEDSRAPQRADQGTIIVEHITKRPRWKLIGMATVLAGAIPSIGANLALLLSFRLVGEDIMYPPLRGAYLSFYFLLHLLPLPLGILAGLLWPGRHLGGYGLLASLAGVIEAIILGSFVVVTRVAFAMGFEGMGQGIQPRLEDFVAVLATAVLFVAGGAIADSIEKLRSSRGLVRGTVEDSEHEKEFGQMTTLFLRFILPAILTLLGIIIQVIPALVK
jgi:DNA-binding transcriptional MerR regulator